jgi:hypothetical protein
LRMVWLFEALCAKLTANVMFLLRG